MNNIVVGLLSSLLVASFKQDTPLDIAKKDLPKAAHCTVCEAAGSAHGEEKPAAGFQDAVNFPQRAAGIRDAAQG